MLKSCAYCGRIHDSKVDCGKKPKRKYYNRGSTQDEFRSTSEWQHKRDEIRDRDRNLCQVCFRNIYDTKVQYNCKDLSVHHAVPLHDDYKQRLDNNNLITLCEKHHRMAEEGRIPYLDIKRIINEQEKRL